jgi:hypothetical protein
MTPPNIEFIRKLGCLRIEINHLKDNLRTNNLSNIESESQAIEELLLHLVTAHRKLTKQEQIRVRPRFVELRQEALHCLEASRNIMDDSLEAMLWLVKTVQDNGNYGTTNTGGSFLVDRRA